MNSYSNINTINTINKLEYVDSNYQEDIEYECYYTDNYDQSNYI